MMINKLSDLKPADYNPREISKDSFQGLKYSLEEFGDISGITFNIRTGNLVSGHQRVKALQEKFGNDHRCRVWRPLQSGPGIQIYRRDELNSLYKIYYGRQLRIFIHNPECEASLLCASLIISMDHSIVENPAEADLAIAPLLNTKLSPEEYKLPGLGTLIFHPSLLPRHRGPDAIKWAYRLNENYTGVTWFWCSEGYDEGDICEQEVIGLDPNIRPGEFYKNEVLPAMLRSLQRVLENLKNGFIRRVPQYPQAATYEKKIIKGVNDANH